MWLILLFISIVNGAANDRGWAQPIRLDFGPFHFNVFLLTVLVGLALALLPPKNTEFLPRHPLYMPTIFLFIFGLIIGIVGTLLNDVQLLFNKDIGFAVRDYMFLPISIFVGYRLAASRKTVSKFPLIMVLVGLAVSINVGIFFKDAASEVTISSNINEIRTNAFTMDYTGLAFALILFSFVTNISFLPRSLTLFLGSVCLLGQVAPLARSSWVACIAGAMGALYVVPKIYRSRAIGMSILMVPVVVLTLWVGIYMASAATGWNFYEKMQERVMTLLPNGDDTPRRGHAAWETRTGGIAAELGLWRESPIYGLGFGIQESRGFGETDIGVHHNAWTDILAKTGVIGLVPYLMVFIGCIVIGRRMVRDNVDQTSVLMGATAVILAAYYIILGASTWSFNDLRSGICVGIFFGVLLRCREFQLADVQELVTAPEYASEPQLAFQ